MNIASCTQTPNKACSFPKISEHTCLISHLCFSTLDHETLHRLEMPSMHHKTFHRLLCFFQALQCGQIGAEVVKNLERRASQ